MKLILISSIQLDLLISKFRNLIQSWKVWEKHQNNKSSYGIQAFPKNSALVPYSPNSMFYNNPPLSSKNDCLEIVLGSTQIQMLMKTM
jgi:hypothetical protein